MGSRTRKHTNNYDIKSFKMETPEAGIINGPRLLILPPNTTNGLKLLYWKRMSGEQKIIKMGVGMCCSVGEMKERPRGI